MASDHPDEWADRFLGGLRKSTEIAEELIKLSSNQASRIEQLEQELAAAVKKAAVLEEQLKKSLEVSGDQLSELLQEQNCLAHAFVAGDRLMRVRSVKEALDTVEEVLTNFAGVVRYGLWLCWSREPTLVLSWPRGAEMEPAVHSAVERIVAQRPSKEPAGSRTLPLCVPLKLGDDLAGVLAVTELGPQVDGIGSLQQDLFRLLSERCSTSLCLGAMRARTTDRASWELVRDGWEGVWKEPT